MLLVRPLPIAIEFVAYHDGPVLLVTISLRLQEALPFKCLSFVSIVLTEALQRLSFLRLIRFLRLVMLCDATLVLILHLLQKAFIRRLVELM